MSEITLRYRLTLEDLLNFNKIALSGNFRSMRIASMFLAVLTGGLFIATGMKLTGIGFAAAFLLSGLLYPAIVCRKTKKALGSSFFLSHDLQLEFYNDHLVEKMLPTQESALETENHIPFEKIIHITESDDLFLFLISPLEAIVAPKRAFSDEDRKKLFYLIQNLFSDKFDRINLDKIMKEDKSNKGKRG